jgi:hypothetical protein
MRGLRADTDAIEAERRHLFDEGQGLATRLEEPVGPREEGVESAPGEPKATGSGRTETPSARTAPRAGACGGTGPKGQSGNGRLDSTSKILCAFGWALDRSAAVLP